MLFFFNFKNFQKILKKNITAQLFWTSFNYNKYNLIYCIFY